MTREISPRGTGVRSASGIEHAAQVQQLPPQSRLSSCRKSLPNALSINENKMKVNRGGRVDNDDPR